jgi:hypothetical protein
MKNVEERDERWILATTYLFFHFSTSNTHILQLFTTIHYFLDFIGVF